MFNDERCFVQAMKIERDVQKLIVCVDQLRKSPTHMVSVDSVSSFPCLLSISTVLANALCFRTVPLSRLFVRSSGQILLYHEIS